MLTIRCSFIGPEQSWGNKTVTESVDRQTSGKLIHRSARAKKA